jgi:hypothetical protein
MTKHESGTKVLIEVVVRAHRDQVIYNHHTSPESYVVELPDDMRLPERRSAATQRMLIPADQVVGTLEMLRDARAAGRAEERKAIAEELRKRSDIGTRGQLRAYADALARKA